MKESLKKMSVAQLSSSFKTLVWKKSRFEWIIIVFRSVVLASITYCAIFCWWLVSVVGCNYSKKGLTAASWMIFTVYILL